MAECARLLARAALARPAGNTRTIALRITRSCAAEFRPLPDPASRAFLDCEHDRAFPGRPL